MSDPKKDGYQRLLEKSCELALAYVDTIHESRVGSEADYPAVLKQMGGALPEHGEDPQRVIEQLAKVAAAALVATTGPRYFGFVIGGAMPVTIAAEWLTSTWDQNAFSYVLSPAAAVAEEVVRVWLTELFGLAADVSLGFTTGATMANFTALAAARHSLLANMGWDVETQGLFGAPEITVITSDESHVSLFAALQMLGLGRERVIRVPTDGQGRMKADELRRVLADARGPLLVCAQAGNVNTGAFDPFPEIASEVHRKGGWLHVDGAFGLWAAASPNYKKLAAGIELADSLAVDAHKWLNVPQDCGMVFVRDSAAHRAAMTLEAPYFVSSPGEARCNGNWVPEGSRRARGFAVYAALRALGREGIAELVDRCCRMARRMAERLAAAPSVQVLNEVVLNQVLVRFSPSSGGDADAFTAKVIRAIQQDGTCWAGGTTWHGVHAMRISVSNWSTMQEDIDRSADAMLKCLRRAEAEVTRLVGTAQRK